MSVAVWMPWTSLTLDSAVVSFSLTGSALIEAVLSMGVGGTNWRSFFLNNILMSAVTSIRDQN